MEGDPHVRVQYENEEPICFDVSSDDGAVLDLLSDFNTGLEVNGQLITENVKKNKSRLERVGFVTPAGVEIGVYTDRVTIGRAARTMQAFNYDRYT